MLNIIPKIIASAIFSIFVLFEILIFMFGEGIMFGHRVFDDTIRSYAVAVITTSSLSIYLIYKDKPIGYIILGLSIVITVIIYFGHRMLWWPCEYCSF